MIKGNEHGTSGLILLLKCTIVGQSSMMVQAQYNTLFAADIL